MPRHGRVSCDHGYPYGRVCAHAGSSGRRSTGDGARRVRSAIVCTLVATLASLLLLKINPLQPTTRWLTVSLTHCSSSGCRERRQTQQKQNAETQLDRRQQLLPASLNRTDPFNPARSPAWKAQRRQFNCVGYAPYVNSPMGSFIPNL